MSIDVYCISHISLHFMDCMISRGWLCHIVPSLEVEVVEVGGQKPAKVSDDLASPRGSLWITLTAEDDIIIQHDSSWFIMIQPSIQAISSYFIIFQHISIWCDHYVTIWLENFPIFKDRLQGRILSPPGDVTSDTKSDTSGTREELLGALVQPLSSTFHLVSSCFILFLFLQFLSSFFHPFPSLLSNVLRCFEYMLLKSDELLINQLDMHSTCNDDCVN